MALIDLLCIGNVMVDIFAEVDEALSGSLGRRFGITAPVQHVSSECIDRILSVLSQTRSVSGGGAATTAKIAAALGVRTAFAGCIGESPSGTDAFGSIFRRELEEAGVQLYLSTRGQTGRCLILRNPKGTTIAAAPGEMPEAASIPKALYREAKILMLDGYMLDRQDIRPFIERAGSFDGAAADRRIALDAGSAAVVRSKSGTIAALLQEYPLVLFMNEDEGCAFLPENRNAVPGKSIIVLKKAERGAAVITGEKTITVDTKPLNTANSTGAGDAFAAGFLDALLKRQSLRECARAGNRTAGSYLSLMQGF